MMLYESLVVYSDSDNLAISKDNNFNPFKEKVLKTAKIAGKELKKNSSYHGKKRRAQRGMTHESIYFCFYFGDVFPQKGGSTVYYLSEKAVEKNGRFNAMKEILRDHTGTTVVMSEKNMIITIYKNKDIKNLSKHFKSLNH
jgi:hypothetical protein